MPRMRRLSRYLFMECAGSVLTALAVLTFLIMLPQVLHLVDLWVNKGVSVAVLGRMTLLSIPQFMVAALPMALLVGNLMALGRLAQDSEIIILKASGLSLFQIARPVALLALLFTLFSLLLNSVWLPEAFHKFLVLKQALVSSTTLSLKNGTFNQSIPGLTIYVQEQPPSGRVLKGILIHDQRNPREAVTLTARSGQLLTTETGETVLFLQDGSRHQRLAQGQYRKLAFATYNLDLGVSLGLRTEDKAKKIDELSMKELNERMAGVDPGLAHTARMEWHRRMAFPGATLILGLFAVPLGMQQSHRSGRGYGFVLAVLTLIVHFLLLAMGESLAVKGVVASWIGFWMPNLLMAALTIHVMVQTSRGRPFAVTVWLAQGLSILPQRLLRSSRTP